MKLIRFFTIRVLLVIAAALTLFASASNAQVVRQTNLYIDNGFGAFSVLQSLGAGTISFPAQIGSAALTTSAGITLFTGPAATHTWTYTLPDASATLAYLSGDQTFTGGLTINGGLTLGTPLGLSSGGSAVDNTAITQNYVFAGPGTGSSAGDATFRPLVAADIPPLSGTYLPLAGGTMAGNIAMNSNNITMGGGNISGGGTITATSIVGTGATSLTAGVNGAGGQKGSLVLDDGTNPGHAITIMPGAITSSYQLGIPGLANTTISSSNTTARMVLVESATGVGGQVLFFGPTSNTARTYWLPDQTDSMVTTSVLGNGVPGGTYLTATLTSLGLSGGGHVGRISTSLGQATAYTLPDPGAATATIAINTTAGVNSDITSLTGLTTALPVDEGGTGTTALGSLTSTTTGVTIGGTGNTVGSNITVDIATASATQDGLLSSADWNTFNGKANAFTAGDLTTSTTGLTIVGGTGATVDASGATVDIATASGTQAGLLSSVDWTTFNGKENAFTNGSLTSTTTGVTIGGSGNTVGSNITVDIATASGSQDGLLSSTDWNTFNGKANAFTAGDLTTSTTGLTIVGGTGATVDASGATVDIATASGSQDGLLSSVDWTTFNGKEDAFTNGSLTSTTTGVTIGGTGNTVGSNITVDIATASATQDGLLSSTDWNTFNGKANAFTAGDLTTSTTGLTIVGGTGATVDASGATVDIATASGSQAGLLSSADWTTFNGKANSGTNSDITSLTGLTTALEVSEGGTGATTFTSNAILYGNSTSAIQALTPNATATNKFLTQSSANSGVPAWNTIQPGDISGVVLLAPTAVQTITPTSDIVPLTIKNFATGTSDELDIQDGSGNSVARFSPGLNGLTLGNSSGGTKQGILRLYNAAGSAVYNIAPTGTVVEVNTSFEADGSIQAGRGSIAGSLKISDGTAGPNYATLNDPDATNSPVFNLPAETGAGPYTLATTGDITGNFVLLTPASAQAIQATTDAIVPLTIEAHSATQSADLQDWSNSTPSVLASIDASGDASFVGLTSSGSSTIATSGSTINTFASGGSSTNSFGSGGSSTNSFGDGGIAMNTFGTGGSAINTIGSDGISMTTILGGTSVGINNSSSSAGATDIADGSGSTGSVSIGNTTGGVTITSTNWSASGAALTAGGTATAGSLALTDGTGGKTYTLKATTGGSYSPTFLLPAETSGGNPYTLATTADIPSPGNFIKNGVSQQTSASFNIDGNGTLGGTLTNAGDATLGTGASATANSFGTSGNAAAVANTIGSTFTGSTTTINGETELSNTTATGGGEVRTDYTVADATSVASTRATGNYTEAISNSGGLSYPTATGILADAEWTGGLNTTDQIVGLQGETHPGSGITALGVVGEADQTNPTDNTGVLGFAVNGGNANVGVAGTSNATEAQIVTYQGTLPAGFGAGVLGYNQASTAGQYSGYFYGLNNAAGSSTVRIQSDPGNAITPGIDEFALSNWISGTDGEGSASASPTTIRGQYNNAQSSGNNMRTEGGLFEAATNGVGLGASSDNAQATGMVGLADYDNGSNAPTTDFLVGVRGAVYTASNSTNGLNVVGENFGGSYYRSVGGYFYPSDGSDANLGVVAQIGGSDQGAWQDAAFTGINAAVVGINYNTPSSTDLAGYFGGNVVATGNITTGAAVVPGALLIHDGSSFGYIATLNDPDATNNPTFNLPAELGPGPYTFTLATTADIAAITGNYVALAPSATQTIKPSVTDVVPLTIQGFDASVDLQDWNNSSSLTVASIDASGDASFVKLTSTGNSTIATGGGTTNTFGASATLNTIGGSATTNTIGSEATGNNIGLDATVNNIGANDAVDGDIIATTTNIGKVSNGANANVNIGSIDNANTSSNVTINGYTDIENPSTSIMTINSTSTAATQIGNTTGGTAITGATSITIPNPSSVSALTIDNASGNTGLDISGNNWTVTQPGAATFNGGVTLGNNTTAGTATFWNGDGSGSNGTLGSLAGSAGVNWNLPATGGTLALQGSAGSLTSDATANPDWSNSTGTAFESTDASTTVTIKLPTPASGAIIYVTWQKSSTVTLDAPATKTILGGSSWATVPNSQGATLMGNGTNWYVVGIY